MFSTNWISKFFLIIKSTEFFFKKIVAHPLFWKTLSHNVFKIDPPNKITLFFASFFFSFLSTKNLHLLQTFL
jgi:hypothetical protein